MYDHHFGRTRVPEVERQDNDYIQIFNTKQPLPTKLYEFQEPNNPPLL